MLEVNGVVAFAAPFRHAIRIPPLGDYPGDNCQRLRATRGDGQLAYPQLELLIGGACVAGPATPLTSLTRKRSLVQSQYRPPDLPRYNAGLADSATWRPGDYRPRLPARRHAIGAIMRREPRVNIARLREAHGSHAVPSLAFRL